MERQRARFALVMGVLLVSLVSMTHAQQTGKKEYTFRGKVEAVDPKAKTLTVNGEKVEGWMEAMKMTYSVDKEDVLGKVKTGDQIMATVYEGDTKMLHNVQVIPATKPN